MPGRDHDGIGGDQFDFARAIQRRRRSGASSTAARWPSRRIDATSQPSLNCTPRSFEDLLQQLGEERAIRRAFVGEQHAAGEWRIAGHRRLGGDAFGSGVSTRCGTSKRLSSSIAGARLFDVALAPEHMQHARALFVVEAEARFDLGHHLARQIDQRPQARVLAANASGSAQEGELLRRTRAVAVSKPGLNTMPVLLCAARAHERRAEPDVERRGQHRAAMPVGRALRDRGVALDHANAVAGRMQLISGGDTADTAADDDDIHDSFAPEGVTLAKRGGWWSGAGSSRALL